MFLSTEKFTTMIIKKFTTMGKKFVHLTRTLFTSALLQTDGTDGFRLGLNLLH
jgi:hypothetical protein